MTHTPLHEHMRRSYPASWAIPNARRPRNMLPLAITPHSRLNLEELSQQPNLDPLLNLLTLPVRPDRDTVVLPTLVQRFPQLTEV